MLDHTSMKNPIPQNPRSKEDISINEKVINRKGLSERTVCFARQVRDLIKSLPANMCDFEYIKQLVRSSSSVGANFIEATESLSKKDFIHRLKICRKEAKDSAYWLNLIETTDEEQNKSREKLADEGIQMTKIFSSIILKYSD